MEPTPQTQQEADRVELVYTYVLAQLGAKTVKEVLALWANVPVGQAAQTASSWLARATSLILSRRGEARELGIAYYRVVRALRTGTTVPHPFNEEALSTQVSLELLRQEFEALVAEHTGEGSTEVDEDLVPNGDDDSIEVEPLEGFTESLEDDEDSSEVYLQELLTDMAEVASDRVEGIAPDMSNADARRLAKQHHLQDGAMVSAAAARVSMNGARNATNQASVRDARIKGWVRQHGQSDHPCYFCSMHISRRVLFRNALTAGKGRTHTNEGRLMLGDGMFKFHDNCHCTAVPVYYDADFATNPKYAMNRKYAALWDQHIKGKYSGSDAINEWRLLLRRLRNSETKSVAQEAA